MKVVHVIQRFYPNVGGAETHVFEICRRLRKRGVQIEIYTADLTQVLPRTQILKNILIRRFKSWAPGDNFYFPYPKMCRGIKSIKADIVHVHSIHDFPLLVAAMMRNKRQKLIFTPHYCGYGVSQFTNFLWSFYKPLAGWALRRADLIISVSNYETRILKQDFRPDPDKIRLIPNGLDIEKLKNVKWKPDHKEIRILYVGRLVKNKNVGELIKMMRILIMNFNLDNSKLVIVGDGSYKSKLQKLAGRIRLEKYIEWKGILSRSDLLNEYSRARVFILPSQIEAFGISAAEAIAIGVPTIVAKSGALTDYVETGLVYGVDVPVNGQTIASQVVEVLRNRKNTISEYNRNYFCSWDEVAERVLVTYRECLE